MRTAALIVTLAVLGACNLDLLLNGGECSQNGDCHGSKICVDAKCVDCENDRDCDSGDVCEDGDCVRNVGGEGEGDVGEGEGEGDVGEGEGEGEGEQSLGARVCAHVDGDCAQACDAAFIDANVATVEGVTGDAKCQQMASLVIAFLECETTASCSEITANTECPTQADAITNLSNEGAAPCLNGEPSVAIPSGWLCPGTFFGSGDGCDCGCGAQDADCAGVSGATCTAPGCNGDGCSFCYASNADAAAGTTGTQNGTVCDPPSAGEGEGEGE